MSADETSRRGVTVSPMNSAAPNAAMTGTLSWTTAARVRESSGSAAYQMA
jgi:hypothetical protein